MKLGISYSLHSSHTLMAIISRHFDIFYFFQCCIFLTQVASYQDKVFVHFLYSMDLIVSCSFLLKVLVADLLFVYPCDSGPVLDSILSFNFKISFICYSSFDVWMDSTLFWPTAVSLEWITESDKVKYLITR